MKNEDNASVDDRECHMNDFSLERKKNVKFEGMARFCMVNPRTMYFTPYNGHATRANVMNDSKGLHFAIFNFKTILGA